MASLQVAAWQPLPSDECCLATKWFALEHYHHVHVRQNRWLIETTDSSHHTPHFSASQPWSPRIYSPFPDKFSWNLKSKGKNKKVAEIGRKSWIDKTKCTRWKPERLGKRFFAVNKHLHRFELRNLNHNDERLGLPWFWWSIQRTNLHIFL